MKRKLNKVLCIIFALLMCCIYGVTAFAAESVSVNVDVNVKLTGEVPKTPEKNVFVLRSVDTGREFTCTVNGEGKGTFEGVTFDKAGIYNFVLTEQEGSNPDCSYDKTVYYLTITVYYNEDSYDFEIAAKVFKDGADEKQDSIVFENVYKEITTEKVTTKEKITEKTENKDEPDNPNTGDNSGMPMWLGLFAISFVFTAGAFIVLVPRKKDSEEIN